MGWDAPSDWRLERTLPACTGALVRESLLGAEAEMPLAVTKGNALLVEDLGVSASGDGTGPCMQASPSSANFKPQLAVLFFFVGSLCVELSLIHI